MIRKIVAVWVSLAMLFGLVVIVDVVTDITPSVRATTLYVNSTGLGGAYTSIQDAINDSNDGDTVFVYSGTYYENVVVNKTINLIGEDRNTTIIDGGGTGDVVRIVADWVKMTDFTITESGTSGWPSANIDAGIELYSVQFSSVSNCSISNSLNGILLILSNNNTINNNTCITYGGYGLCLISTSNSNTISNNTVIGPGPIAGYDNIVVTGSSFFNMITNNYCSSGWDGIYIITNSNFNTVHNNTFTENRNGIVHGGDSNTFTNNNISNNQYGIFVNGGGEYNIYKYNFISQNDYGAYLHSNYHTTLFHNNFINNTNQAYDDGTNTWNHSYPSGGNYWSDYTGVDDYRGPNQDIPGSDGIGDTNYSISGGANIDHYPLWKPYNSQESSMILKQGWNLISLPLIQDDTNLTRVLGSIDGLYDAVQWWNVSDGNDQWTHNRVGKPYGNDLFELNESMGFWVHITQPGDTIFLYNGTQPTSNQSITLHPGWNMVGYPSLSNRTRDNALNNINYDTDIDAIWTFNAATQTWQEIGPSDYFELGRGYWIHSKVTKTWDVPL